MATPGSQNDCCRRADGAGCPAGSGERINSFSLVSYIPGALGDRLTRLREELVPGCTARSHVTVLPPRPLALPPDQAAAELRRRLTDFRAFEVELPRLSMFEETAVIFAEIREGRQQLLDMHASLATGSFEFLEPWQYHPHVTLVQGIPPDEAAALFDALAGEWRPTRFAVERLTFVQNTTSDRWVDLVDYTLEPEESLVGC